ncbi:MAG TPA: TIM-barrel domain-containing protein [Prolixibacteraceae bacterium]|nr:TIM-barrel domain-containing protein [Prolixibacteraceae bacterium]
MMKIKNLFFIVLFVFLGSTAFGQLQGMGTLNEPIDISSDFASYTNTYYLADELKTFDPVTASGTVEYKRYEYFTRQAFNNMMSVLAPVEANEFPGREYEASPNLPFKIQFVSPRTVRIRMNSGPDFTTDDPSLMLVDGKAPIDNSWKYSAIEGGHKYTSKYGSIAIYTNPWKVILYDINGKELTSTNHNTDNSGKTYTPVMPFGYVRRAADYSRSFSASMHLAPGEKIYGLGESYVNFNKRGSRVVVSTDDANGIQNETTYKPIPFYMSSKGYGVFMHTSTPITCDFGKYYSNVQQLMIGDETLDLFFFIGSPKEILDAYTDLTGKAAMPPLWSFGFWMSRITYFSEDDGRAVAKKLRENKIPSDVIHFDTGWFETDWQCDYRFSKTRFNDPQGMIKDLKSEGFETCLWQLPYFVPKNSLFNEIVENGLHVKSPKGNIPAEDAVLDFSNPATVKWYQDKIAGLLKLGVGAIKVDFGEAAPYNGIYASGRTGFYEHNLYPLRYNKAVADITKEITGESIIWARSTWAGSQRYPLHWGGDPAASNSAMASSLRGGLSIGLSGFSFWSHDIGGFVESCAEDLYARWTPFGMLSSHTRSHGAPPTEPWEYSLKFLNGFRDAANLRYQLMPYIYAQAKHSSENGLPMMRAMFIEYPDDPGAWLVDDAYLFGQDILVAPLFEEITSRDVYLPGGVKWIDYQTGKSYSAGWNHIVAGKMPIIMLVREGAAIPHVKLAQSTKFIDWSKIELKVFGNGNAKGYVCLPEDQILKQVVVSGGKLVSNPLDGKSTLKVIK